MDKLYQLRYGMLNTRETIDYLNLRYYNSLYPIIKQNKIKSVEIQGRKYYKQSDINNIKIKMEEYKPTREVIKMFNFSSYNKWYQFLRWHNIDYILISKNKCYNVSQIKSYFDELKGNYSNDNKY